MIYIYKRGEGIRRRVFHIASHDRFGEINGSLCRKTEFDTTINLPLGKKICKLCLKELRDIHDR